ncbi:unnamed protein product [Lampetra planeri]
MKHVSELGAQYERDGYVTALSVLSDAELRAVQAGYDACVAEIGGFGVAKNLSSWASEGRELLRCCRAWRRRCAPSGRRTNPWRCAASPPVLAARLFPGCELTVGGDSEQGGRFPYAGTAAAIRELGCTHVCTDVGEAHVDAKLKIVTTSAFMCATAPIHHVHDRRRRHARGGKGAANIVSSTSPWPAYPRLIPVERVTVIVNL